LLLKFLLFSLDSYLLRVVTYNEIININLLRKNNPFLKVLLIHFFLGLLMSFDINLQAIF
jgi:hypothetical protein